MKMAQSPQLMKYDEAIQCIFDLNRLDIDVYKKLQEIGTVRTDEIAKYLKKERSTVYRSLQKLTSCGICQKIRKTLEQGGYYHMYKMQSDRTVRKEAERCLDKWYESMKQML